MLHCIFSSGCILSFALRNPKSTQHNSTDFVMNPVLFSSLSVLCVWRELPTARVWLCHCLHVSLRILLWAAQKSLPLVQDKGWCGENTLYLVAVCCPVAPVYCLSNKFGILLFEEALCFWLHWETVVYLHLLETDGFKGDLTKKSSTVLSLTEWH